MRYVLTLESLQAIEIIDKKGSFAAAAEALFKVPSALSYTISKLESELNIKLFDRSKQRAVLTPAGRLVLQQGSKILQAARELENSVHQLESGWEMTLRIALDTVLPLRPMLELVRRFQDLNKQVDLDLHEEVLGGTWDALIHDRCDLAIGASGDLPKGIFECVKLADVEFVFAVSKDHPLRNVQRPLDSEDIDSYPAVIAGDSSIVLPGRTSGLLAGQQSIRVANMAAKVQAQMTGVGVGFLPRHLIQRELEEGELIALTCKVPRPEVPVYLAWRKHYEGKALYWFASQCQAVDWLAAPI